EWSSVSDPSDSSGAWKALFFTVLIVLILILSSVGCLYKYRDNLTGTICLKDLKDVITIDRERSHPDLKVSEDCKITRDSPEHNYTDEGFPYQLCAFGAQKFTSGRHYWEVDLARENTPPKSYWLIGVVKEGRFASKDRSALTPSAGYWFLCSDGPHGFYTSTDPPVKLSLTPRPERLGVLFDYDDGQLSFYNVNERKHLLIISSRFSGSVVPLFNPGAGDQSALEILNCPIFVESIFNMTCVLYSKCSEDVFY
uniref:B30.2/SPRY domain-containing protein n=1 Tax=Sinocyclocheilus rhinocerous TaxID=307959 RepID=A0A673HMV6_9TELE